MPRAALFTAVGFHDDSAPATAVAIATWSAGNHRAAAFAAVASRALLVAGSTLLTATHGSSGAANACGEVMVSARPKRGRDNANAVVTDATAFHHDLEPGVRQRSVVRA